MPKRTRNPEFVSVAGTAEVTEGTSIQQRADWTEGTSFSPTVHLFDGESSGPRVQDTIMSESDIFKLFVTPNLIEHIVLETNRHYQFAINKLAKIPARMERWADTSIDEMYLFIALSMLMTRNARTSLHEHWSTDPLLYSPIYSDVMSRNRFQLLMRTLHFADDENPDSGDTLFKVRDVIEELRTSFKEKFYPHRDLCVYESLELFKGHLLVSQNMPLKTKTFDIKLFIICDCQTGYILDYMICTSGTPEIKPNLHKPTDILMSLISPYLDCGHNLYTDKEFSSPELFETLHMRKTNVCGTVNNSKINLPEFKMNLMKNKSVMFHTNNLMALKWAGNKSITFMSTLHSNNLCKTGKLNPETKKDILKPACIVDYERMMGNLDRSDMMLCSMDSVRKCIKWYKKVFFHLIELSLFNAYKIYEEKSGRCSLADFQTEVIKQLIQVHKQSESYKKPVIIQLHSRLTDRHFISTTPSTATRINATRKCHVCSRTTRGPRKRKETRYMCRQCNVPLCVVPCFELYHTQQNY